eukprot:CAMPEP_0180812406 /NCGR_PEP_ID=MMETSP1038_2-20121128/65983_1 /TAXON_ID=632150 /ORGANISM="Azadinium spinosum, Strain 3D9" /LENGTH=32 /DNA_ID= /DNA_START= /DNA_END= /DNA_ORIENTATION=
MPRPVLSPPQRGRVMPEVRTVNIMVAKREGVL